MIQLSTSLFPPLSFWCLWSLVDSCQLRISPKWKHPGDRGRLIKPIGSQVCDVDLSGLNVTQSANLLPESAHLLAVCPC